MNSYIVIIFAMGSFATADVSHLLSNYLPSKNPEGSYDHHSQLTQIPRISASYPVSTGSASNFHAAATKQTGSFVPSLGSGDSAFTAAASLSSPISAIQYNVPAASLSVESHAAPDISAPSCSSITHSSPIAAAGYNAPAASGVYQAAPSYSANTYSAPSYSADGNFVAPAAGYLSPHAAASYSAPVRTASSSTSYSSSLPDASRSFLMPSNLAADYSAPDAASIPAPAAGSFSASTSLDSYSVPAASSLTKSVEAISSSAHESSLASPISAETKIDTKYGFNGGYFYHKR